MKSYVISTDSSADLSEAYLKEHQITMISLSCILNGKIYNSENPIIFFRLKRKLSECPDRSGRAAG